MRGTRSKSGIGKTQQEADPPISFPRPTYRIHQPNKVIDMNVIKLIGKECKSRTMNLTEAEAGAFVLLAAAVNIVLILIWLLK